MAEDATVEHYGAYNHAKQLCQFEEGSLIWGTTISYRTPGISSFVQKGVEN